MSKIAEELKQSDRERVRAMTASERLELALRLGDDDLETFCHRHGLSHREGLSRLRANRQLGRRPSACMEAVNR